MRFYYLIPIFAIVLSGCGGGASVSQNQCAAGDWQTLGYRDGVRGYRSTELLAHQDACGKHGVIPDRHGYTGASAAFAYQFDLTDPLRLGRASAAGFAFTSDFHGNPPRSMHRPGCKLLGPAKQQAFEAIGSHF